MVKNQLRVPWHKPILIIVSYYSLPLPLLDGCKIMNHHVFLPNPRHQLMNHPQLGFARKNPPTGSFARLWPSRHLFANCVQVMDFQVAEPILGYTIFGQTYLQNPWPRTIPSTQGLQSNAIYRSAVIMLVIYPPIIPRFFCCRLYSLGWLIAILWMIFTSSVWPFSKFYRWPKTRFGAPFLDDHVSDAVVAWIQSLRLTPKVFELNPTWPYLAHIPCGAGLCERFLTQRVRQPLPQDLAQLPRAGAATTSHQAKDDNKHRTSDGEVATTTTRTNSFRLINWNHQGLCKTWNAKNPRL